VKNSKEGFLANFFNELRRSQFASQLDPDQFTKVSNKVTFCLFIAGSQQRDVI